MPTKIAGHEKYQKNSGNGMRSRGEDLVESLGSLWRTGIPIKMEISEYYRNKITVFLPGEFYISDNFLKRVFLSEIILFWTPNMAKKGFE